MTFLANRAPRTPRVTGVGRVLIIVYGILALGATGRSVYQLSEQFSQAPLAYSLSGLSALVYIVATVALIAPGRFWYRVAWSTISFEFTGVIVIGTISTFAPSVIGLDGVDPFGQQSTVWSVYGAGYVFVPLVLPVLGMLWLHKHHPADDRQAEAAAAEPR